MEFCCLFLSLMFPQKKSKVEGVLSTYENNGRACKKEGRGKEKKQRMGGDGSLLSGRFPSGHLAPDQEAVLHEGAVIPCSETMSFRVKMIRDRTKSGKETLCMPRGFEASHDAFSLSRRLVRAFRSIVEPFVLAMFDTWQDLAFGCPIALQFISDDDAWHVLEPFEELTEEAFRCVFVPSALHQNIKHVAVLIDGSPQIRPFSINGEKDLIQIPLVPTRRTAAAEFVRVCLTKLQTPLAHGFIRQHHTTFSHNFLNVAITQRETEIQPETVTDNFWGESIPFIGAGCGVFHLLSLSVASAFLQVDSTTMSFLCFSCQPGGKRKRSHSLIINVHLQPPGIL